MKHILILTILLLAIKLNAQSFSSSNGVFNSAASQIVQGKVKGIDVNTSNSSYIVEGDIISASSTNGTEIVIQHPPIPLDAVVQISVESLSNVQFDNDTKSPVFRRDSTTQTTVFFEETSLVVQNIAINLIIKYF